MPSLYKDARGILNAFKEKGVDVAIASRSPAADTAKTFLDKHNITSMFVAKVRHGGSSLVFVLFCFVSVVIRIKEVALEIVVFLTEHS